MAISGARRITVPRSLWFKNLGGDSFCADDSGQGLGGSDVSGEEGVGGMPLHSGLAVVRLGQVPVKAVFRKIMHIKKTPRARSP